MEKDEDNNPHYFASLAVTCLSRTFVPKVSPSMSSVAVAKTFPALTRAAQLASASHGAFNTKTHQITCSRIIHPDFSCCSSFLRRVGEKASSFLQIVCVLVQVSKRDNKNKPVLGRRLYINTTFCVYFKVIMTIKHRKKV